MPSSVCAASHYPATTGYTRQHGFTLIELIMVIVLLGVLAVFAAPRMLNTGDLNAQGLHDRTLAYLRYAQKTAIAQRRTVCVDFPSDAVSLRIAKNAGVLNCTGTNGDVLNGPDGDPEGFVFGARYATTVTGVSCPVTPTAFNFDALGQPVDATTEAVIAATQCMKVVNATKSITVEAATGYVHE